MGDRHSSHTGPQPLREHQGLGGIDVLQDHRELLPPQTSEEITLLAQLMGEDRGELPQALVAVGMAIRVVDLLEAVDVEQQQGQVAVGDARGGNVPL